MYSVCTKDVLYKPSTADGFGIRELNNTSGVDIRRICLRDEGETEGGNKRDPKRDC